MGIIILSRYALNFLGQGVL